MKNFNDISKPAKAAPEIVSKPHAGQTPATPQPAEKRNWRVLCDNVMEAAGRKSEMLMNAPVVDDAAFDSAARSLRLLVGAAEIAHRMQRTDKLEKENDERAGKTKGLPEDEIERTYQAIRRHVERAKQKEKEIAAGHHGGDAGGAAADVSADACEEVGHSRP